MLQMSSLSVAYRSPLVSKSLRPSQLAFGKAAVPKSLANRPAFTSSDRVTFQVTAGKMKTRKSAAKRYKVTASGKVRPTHHRVVFGTGVLSLALSSRMQAIAA